MSLLRILAKPCRRIPFSADTVDALADYVSEIMLFNPVYKLVGQTDADEIIIAHVLDSAAGCPAFMEMTEPEAVIADLGTGAGLPGIVLSILMPDRHFVLIERMRRRVQFLMGAVARLHLSNAEISEKDIKDEKRAFDAVTARAFHPLYDIIDDVQPILKPDAPAIFYKGQRSNAESELEIFSHSVFMLLLFLCSCGAFCAADRSSCEPRNAE